MLTSIPVISPVEVPLTAAQVQKFLPAGQSQVIDADYTIHEETSASKDAAMYALEEIEEIAYIKEYRDSEWWRERIRMIRKRMTEEP